MSLVRNPIIESFHTHTLSFLQLTLEQTRDGSSVAIHGDDGRLLAAGHAKLNVADERNATVGELIACARALRNLADDMEEAGRLLDLIRDYRT